MHFDTKRNNNACKEGKKIYDLLRELFPICRSITGNGLRQTYKILNKTLPLNIFEIKTGTKCFDWTIPDEWNIYEAYIVGPDGKKIVDFANNNLHIVNYSIPFSGTLSLEELKKHLHSIPSKPNVIPYKTTYYNRNWGFCIKHKDLIKLKKGYYQVHINSSLKKGSITLADALLPGKTKKEIFFSSYVCHPSMANDSLSGVVIAAALYKFLRAYRERYYTYRFIFVPETIGAIAYLSLYKKHFLKNIHAGFVLTCLGNPATFNYKKTRDGNHQIDKICANILKHSGYKYKIRDFWLPGSDERQYSSPGFNLPVASLMRSVYGEFKEYHTSADNLKFVTPKALGESFLMYSSIIKALEKDFKYKNTNPFCEIHLSKYGLYENPLSENDPMYLKKILTVLNFSDGKHSLCDIADKLNISVLELIPIVELLQKKNLLELQPEI